MIRQKDDSNVINFSGGVKCDVILCSNCHSLVGYYSKKSNTNDCPWICCIGRSRIGEDAQFIKEATWRSYGNQMQDNNYLNDSIKNREREYSHSKKQLDRVTINTNSIADMNDNSSQIKTDASTRNRNIDEKIKILDSEYSQLLIPTSVIKKIVHDDIDSRLSNIATTKVVTNHGIDECTDVNAVLCSVNQNTSENDVNIHGITTDNHGDNQSDEKDRVKYGKNLGEVNDQYFKFEENNGKNKNSGTSESDVRNNFTEIHNIEKKNGLNEVEREAESTNLERPRQDIAKSKISTEKISMSSESKIYEEKKKEDSNGY